MKYLLIITLFISFSGFAQNKKRKKVAQNYFGITYKPLIPFGLVGDRPVDLSAGNLETTFKPTFGYSLGGTIRSSFTKRLAVETGILYTKRNYETTYSLPDSNLNASSSLGYVNFDIPINALVYIQLSEKLFINTALGVSLNYYVSNVRTQLNPSANNLFITNGSRPSFFSFDVNANVGFEFRTEEKGAFYIGASGKIPLSPILSVFTVYKQDTYELVTPIQEIAGATFALDFRYFFHNVKNKGMQFKGGPIEQ